MNKKFYKISITLVVFIMLMSVGVGSASARPFVTDFTGVSNCVDVPGTGEIVIKDGKMHIMGAESICVDVTDDPRVSGEDRIVINAVLDLSDNLSGPMWGSAVISNEDGSWLGVWSGERTSEGYVYIRMHAPGKEGYRGMQAWWELERLSPDPEFPYTMSGYILDPGK